MGESSTSSSLHSTGLEDKGDITGADETQHGQDFFSHWNFFNGSDPTEGVVEYVDEATAWNENLIEVDWRGHAIIKVETKKHVWGGRKSVRLEGKKVYVVLSVPPCLSKGRTARGDVSESLTGCVGSPEDWC